MKKKILVIFIVSIAILFSFGLFINLWLAPKKYKNWVVAFSDEYDLDIALVYSVIKVESDFDKNAVSKSGALGLMQILPSTAKWITEELGVDFEKQNLFEPELNIRFGCFYLRYLFDKFNDREIVICAYNAGEGKVQDWIIDGKIDKTKIDYAETKNYLTKVNSYFSVYKSKLVFL